MMNRCNWRHKPALFLSLALSAVMYFSASTSVFAQSLDVFTIAGGPRAGYAGDGGAAVDARLSDPTGVVKDVAGNLYISDALNHVIRMVDVNGTITTVAGNGTSGSDGDNGPATDAQLWEPFGIDIDPSGNLVIADFRNNRIRRVDLTTGIITTIAGNGLDGVPIGDGGDPLLARIHHPTDVFVDSSGAIFIADRRHNSIRKVEPDLSSISTVAGNGTQGFSGDEGPATSAMLNLPQGVFVDATGNIFIADSDNNVVRWVEAATGLIHTIAGQQQQGGFAGDGGLADAALLNQPRAIHVDGSGVIYVADTFNHRVRTFTNGGNIDTFAGSGATGDLNGNFNGEGAPATASVFDYLADVYVDASGTVIIADELNNRIRHAVPETLNNAPTGIFFDGPVDVKASDGNGARVAGLSTVDADVGDVHVYSVAGGKGATDIDDFSIDNANVLRIDNPRVSTGDLLVRVRTNDQVDGTFEKEFVITVVDDMVPVITLDGDNPLVIAQFDPYVDPGATALDNLEVDVTADIVIGGDTVDTGVAGTYNVTYDFTDAGGNAAATETRVVMVNAPPTSDIAVMSSGPASLETGSSDTYTVTVTNNGPDDTDGVMVSIDVPTNVVTVDTVSPAASCTISGDGANISCNLGMIANAGTVDITIDVTASAAAGAGTATISASADNVDDDASNDMGSVDITVTAPPIPPQPPKKSSGGGSTGFALIAMLALVAIRRRWRAR